MPVHTHTRTHTHTPNNAHTHAHTHSLSLFQTYTCAVVGAAKEWQRGGRLWSSTPGPGEVRAWSVRVYVGVYREREESV